MPTFEDMINDLASNGSIEQNDVPKYLNNYYFFQDNIQMIESNFRGQWVAALNYTLYNNATLTHLEHRLSTFLDRDYAYIEKVD